MLDGIDMKIVPANQTTTFENIYKDGKRYQRWLASSHTIFLDDVPSAWQNAPIVHLAPVSQEIYPAVCRFFPNSLVCVTVQGWLRGWDADENVIYAQRSRLDDNLPDIDVLVMSLADFFGDKATLNYFASRVKLAVETMGADGCRVYHDGKITHIPTKPQNEVDPTGAGDIFATAFFIRYYQTGDFVKAAKFANTCASLSVGRIGMASIPTLSEVEKQM
jgi:sugar/nucleoside kinase (ribokinase family)